MRVDSIGIENYRGIKYVECGNLSAEPLLLISGKNGTGKSLILEALSMVYSWRMIDISNRVGPYGTSSRINIVFSLDSNELAALNNWTTANGEQPPRGQGIILDVRMFPNGSIEFGQDHDPATSALRNAAFQRQHQFARMEFIPSTRILPARQGMAVDPGILDPQRQDEERMNRLDQYLQSRQPTTLGDVFSYLATTDYIDLMAERDGRSTSDEFESLTAPFSAATGKTIRPPNSMPDFSIQMDVLLPGSGLTHPISELSSGEQELLSLSYLFRRAKAVGGIVLLDEPEQHLHPTLQSAVLRQISSMSANAQVIAVTHSVNILSATPSSAILNMTEPSSVQESQLARVLDDSGRLSLIAQLGLTAADLVQADYVIVVEGESDESLLKTLYPIAVAKATFVVAGDVAGVMKICHGLATIEQVVPYICIRDRDFLGEAERISLMQQYPSLYITQARMIENELLHVALVESLFRRTGNTESTQDIGEILSGLATDEHKADVVYAMLNQRLGAIKPPSPMPELPRGIERQRESYRQLEAAAAERVRLFDTVLERVTAEIDARWLTNSLQLVDGKAALGRLARRSPVKDIRAALAAAFVADEECRPPALAELGQRLQIITPTAPVASSRDEQALP